MNYKMVGKYLGHLALTEAVFLLPSVLAALWYQEHGALRALLLAMGCCVALGAALHILCRKENRLIYAREGFVVAGAGWVIVSLLGALPFFFSGDIPNYMHAFFESASGFTTTGASVLTDVEAMPRALLFWRSFTHWLGGIGVLAFILAVVRAKNGSGFTLHLLRAESPGPQVGKIMPKTRDSVRGLFLVYLVLSLLNLGFLLAGGMPLFDALCTMFGTAGTGGFGIKADSMASYSAYLQTVTTVFMALFGVNFTLYFLLAAKEWRAVLRDEELRVYLGIMLSAIAIVTVSLIAAGFGGFGKSLHHGAFAVSSVMTTTGYTTADFDLWPQVARTVLLLLMMFGAMAGSTGGGFKAIRLLILYKSMKIGLRRLLHPNSVKVVRINQKLLEDEITGRTQLFLVVYCALAVLIVLLISVDGLSFGTNMSAMLACFNNVGPGLELVGPVGNYAVYSNFSVFVLTMAMLLGRLEIFPILFLFFPSTYSRKK